MVNIYFVDLIYTRYGPRLGLSYLKPDVEMIDVHTVILPNS